MKAFEFLSTWPRALSILSLLFLPVALHESTQDLNFRLLNIERRLDQMQIRVDVIERTQQNQAFNQPQQNNISSETIYELQRQLISLSGQMVQLQKQMLELQKKIDRLQESDPKGEKREPVKEEAKPKPKAGKP
jgi:predicted  nucleic acid-binding Zn-ribbon protein